jgi:hypothetical protein
MGDATPDVVLHGAPVEVEGLGEAGDYFVRVLGKSALPHLIFTSAITFMRHILIPTRKLDKTTAEIDAPIIGHNVEAVGFMRISVG